MPYTFITRNELEIPEKMMPREPPRIKEKSAASLNEMQKLEREMGVILLAWYKQPIIFAKLDDAQVERLRELERTLDTTLIAYQPMDG
ncbi:MAG: hypothetical protein SA339_10215 [Methanomassiliicoccus sp.]|nr:hypothetical protein [Methanomassiliicoccus sp.]